MLLTLLALLLLLHQWGLLTHPHPLLRPEITNQANLTDVQDWLTANPTPESQTLNPGAHGRTKYYLGHQHHSVHQMILCLWDSQHKPKGVLTDVTKGH